MIHVCVCLERKTAPEAVVNNPSCIPPLQNGCVLIASCSNTVHGGVHLRDPWGECTRNQKQ